ncbi:hypothetical protein CPC08DRAFT_710690 [Agrocybe pediades]|nr:hypothetical protein CPC08DRAFT_710690 [Agrocybe pediades]
METTSVKFSAATRAALLVIFSLPAISAGQQVPPCSGGRTLECCEQVVPVNSTAALEALAPLGTLGPSDGTLNESDTIGVNCFSAASQVVCTGTFVCCLNNSFNGVVAMDCVEPF